jgi:hypothetical protein
MNRPLCLAVLHQDFVARLWLTVALQEDESARVVIFAGSAMELLSALERVPVDLIVCGGDYALGRAKALRRELWERGLPVVTIRNAMSPLSRRWLVKRCLPSD